VQFIPINHIVKNLTLSQFKILLNVTVIFAKRKNNLRVTSKQSGNSEKIKSLFFLKKSCLYTSGLVVYKYLYL
jgi:hypothetical protein